MEWEIETLGEEREEESESESESERVREIERDWLPGQNIKYV